MTVLEYLNAEQLKIDTRIKYTLGKMDTLQRTHDSEKVIRSYIVDRIYIEESKVKEERLSKEQLSRKERISEAAKLINLVASEGIESFNINLVGSSVTASIKP